MESPLLDCFSSIWPGPLGSSSGKVGWQLKDLTVGVVEASLGSVTKKRTKRGTSCGEEASVRECPGENRGLWGSQLAEGNHMQWAVGAVPSGHRRHTWHTGQTRSKSQQKNSAQLGHRGVVTRGSRDHHQQLISPAITSHKQP